MRVIINKKEIGNNIKLLREKNKMTVDDLSLILNINRIVLLDYEKGLKQINIRDVIVLCNYFNIKIDDFVSYQVIE